MEISETCENCFFVTENLQKGGKAAKIINFRGCHLTKKSIRQPLSAKMDDLFSPSKSHFEQSHGHQFGETTTQKSLSV